MREIKFRAFWDGRFWYFPIGKVWDITMIEVSNALCINGSKWEQFTGLHDKNGKEIYEGDIVECLFGIGPVVYEGVGFTVDCDSIAEGWESTTPLEVIGNIHENSELLK